MSASVTLCLSLCLCLYLSLFHLIQLVRLLFLLPLDKEYRLSPQKQTTDYWGGAMLSSWSIWRVSEKIWPEYNTLYNSKKLWFPNVWENGGAKQYIKPLDTIISLTGLAYVTSLRSRKPFIFMAGFIKTPRAHGVVVVVAKNFFPLHKTRL